MQTEYGKPSPTSLPEAEFLFALYVVDEESRPQEIQDALTQLFDEHLPGDYQLKTINVSRHPEKATRANVLATPTLIKLRPKPAQRVVGDLIVGECLLKELRIFPSETY